MTIPESRVSAGARARVESFGLPNDELNSAVGQGNCITELIIRLGDTSRSEAIKRYYHNYSPSSEDVYPHFKCN